MTLVKGNLRWSAILAALCGVFCALPWLAWSEEQSKPASKPPQADQRWTNSLSMVFAPVPGTKVLFCIWETRVKDFEAFVKDKANNNGYDYRKGSEPHLLKADGWKQRGWDYGWDKPGFPQGDNHPVTCVSWEDAHAFCQWLTATEGKTGRIDPKQEYRLPADEEWSTAVGLRKESGDTPKDKDEKIKDVYPWGKEWPPPQGAGNFAGSEANDSDWPAKVKTIEVYRDGFARTAPAGSFRTNEFGLYDLSGNVWEWCEDWYNPKEPQGRVLRGGSWRAYGPRLLLSSCRGGDFPEGRFGNLGFRCVLVVGGGRR